MLRYKFMFMIFVPHFQGLGANNPRAAKASAIVGIVAGVVIAAAMGTVVAVIPRTLASILSNDEKLLDIFEEIRYPFAAVVVRCQACAWCRRMCRVRHRAVRAPV